MCARLLSYSLPCILICILTVTVTTYSSEIPSVGAFNHLHYILMLHYILCTNIIMFIGNTIMTTNL